jgi:hypothetical protein
MHRSNDTIGNISGALAKAQAELTNPEKSLVAIIRSPFPGEAKPHLPLCPAVSGLDIVRKSLGRHEIATIQSTEIDKKSTSSLGPFLHVRPVNGSPRNGRYARCPISPLRSEWSRPHLCPAVRAFHPGRHCRRDDLDARISALPPSLQRSCHGTAASQWTSCGRGNGQRMKVKRPESAAAGPSSEHSYRQAFRRA